MINGEDIRFGNDFTQNFKSKFIKVLSSAFIVSFECTGSVAQRKFVISIIDSIENDVV
jgi:hypothetical protein